MSTRRRSSKRLARVTLGCTAFLAALVLGTTAAMSGGSTAIRTSAGVTLRDPVPVERLMRTLARESRWPMVWIDAICDEPLAQMRGGQQLHNATYAAACRSRVTRGEDADNLIVARYADEMLARQDLHEVGYTFYTLTRWNGSLFLAGTTSDVTVVDAHGHEVSPALQPLETFALPVLRADGIH